MCIFISTNVVRSQIMSTKSCRRSFCCVFRRSDSYIKTAIANECEYLKMVSIWTIFANYKTITYLSSFNICELGVYVCHTAESAAITNDNNKINDRNKRQHGGRWWRYSIIGLDSLCGRLKTIYIKCFGPFWQMTSIEMDVDCGTDRRMDDE